MKIYIKFDYHTICKNLLAEKFQTLGLKYKTVAFGEVEIFDKLTDKKFKEFQKELNAAGISIVENQKSILVEKIKEALIGIVQCEHPIPVKASVYLTEKLQHSYGYLSNLFSEVTYSSIENFLMLQKVEHAKNLILKENLTLTEVAYRLNYSSVAHLSTQFKNVTGITPSQFQRIIQKRRELAVKK